jgi:hypothetical protein
MINAWSLLYEELNGTMDKTYPIENNELNDDNIVINTGTGNTIFNVPEDVEIDEDIPEVVTVGETNETTSDDDTITITGGDFVNFDLGIGNTAYVDTLNLDFSSSGDDYYPSSFTAFSDNDDSIAHLIDKPVSSGIEDNSPRKYKEDESIEALKNYISTTYGGHYTSDNNSVQTLDLIESVGDAESFCRSNAIKYLSRYDKKGQAKRDILKALHYSLLLYHFSGQLNETPTRGYETF